MISPEAVVNAADRIAHVAHRTPVMTSRTVDERLNYHVFFKCENLQRIGAFKFRGAYNAISRLSAAEQAAGVVTHSSGNHAQGVALAARLLGVRAVVVMPEDSPPNKRAATEGYGAEIVTCPAMRREEVTADLIAAHGYTLIHPYDNDDIIAGQGTAALELLDQVNGLDAFIAPVGGGGLMSGCATALRARSPHTILVGAEPVGADDAQRSLAAGRVVPVERPNSICDGLLATLGEINRVALTTHRVEVLTVDDAAVRVAMRRLWERLKLVVEPSSAITYAVLCAHRERFRGQRVGVLLSGGNVDLDHKPFP